MLTILSAIASLLSFRLRSRASLELEIITLRHQMMVIRRTLAPVGIHQTCVLERDSGRLFALAPRANGHRRAAGGNYLSSSPAKSEA
jgi:hypothetical protein